MRRVPFEKIIPHLKNGGVIIYPTETAYALGADCENKAALKKIMRLKKRRGKHFPLIAAHMHMLKKYAHVNTAVLRLVRGRWPGPLTLVLPSRRKLSPYIMGSTHTIGIRISGYAPAQALSRKLGKPLVATSANISGRPTCYSLSCVRRQFGEASLKDILLVDGGRLPKRSVSTIARIKGKKIKILRNGAIKINQNYLK